MLNCLVVYLGYSTFEPPVPGNRGKTKKVAMGSLVRIQQGSVDEDYRVQLKGIQIMV